MEKQIETRRTDWNICVDGPWHPTMSHGGITAYRIWQQFDGMRWFQRHEWKCANGSIETDDWIRGAEGWCPDSRVVSEEEAA